MGKVALDTNALSAYLAGDAGAMRVIDAQAELYIPLTVYAELLAGFHAGSRLQANLQALQQFMANEAIIILEINHDTAKTYAKIYASLRAKGRPIPTNDIWIAALCLQYGCDLMTRDRDFDYVELLDVVGY